MKIATTGLIYPKELFAGLLKGMYAVFGVNGAQIVKNTSIEAHNDHGNLFFYEGIHGRFTPRG